MGHSLIDALICPTNVSNAIEEEALVDCSIGGGVAVVCQAESHVNTGYNVFNVMDIP